MVKKGRINEDVQQLPQWKELNKPVGNTSMDTIDTNSIGDQKIRRYEQDTNWRRRFSIWIMWIVPIWLTLVLLVVFLVGFKKISLPTSSINVLLATTTANVLGLSYIVLKGMFPSFRGKK